MRGKDHTRPCTWKRAYIEGRTGCLRAPGRVTVQVNDMRGQCAQAKLSPPFYVRHPISTPLRDLGGYPRNVGYLALQRTVVITRPGPCSAVGLLV